MALTTLPGFTINSTSSFTFASANITGNTTTNNITITNYANTGNLQASGNVTASYYFGNGSQLTGIGSAGSISNGTSNVSIPSINGSIIFNVGATASLLALTTTSANLTGNANISGNVVAGNANLGNAVTANYILGNGYYLTGLSSGGTSVANGTSNITIPASSGNINFTVGATNNVFVVTTTGTNTAGYANVTGNLTAGNVIATNLTGTLLTATQTQITQVGTLSSLTVSGNATINGNLSVSGNLSYINSNSIYLEDPLIYQGAGANGAALPTNDGFDRGTILSYYAGGTQVQSFMGWKNANSDFEFASNVSVSTNVITINQLANIRAGNANLGNVVTANYLTGTLTTSSQPNITSVGTLTSLAVTGNITSGNANINGTLNVSGNSTFSNANVSNLTVTSNISATANLSVGNANLGNFAVANYMNLNSNLYVTNNIVASNIFANSGIIQAQTFIGTLQTGNQYNITNIGQLANLTVVANINAGNANLGNTVTSNYYFGNGAYLTGVASPVPNTFTISTVTSGNTYYPLFANGTTGTSAFDTHAYLGYDAGNGIFSANLFNGVFASTASNQPNITRVGTLATLTVTGNAQFTSNSTVKIGGGGNGYLLSTDGSGNLIWLPQSAITASGNSGNSGSSLQYTTATNPPASGNNLGDQWYNVTNNVLYEYISDGVTNYWVDTQSPTYNTGAVSSGYVGRSYAGDGSTANFTVSNGANVFNVLVFLDGICQMPTTDYTITGTIITFIPAPLLGMSIQIRELPR